MMTGLRASLASFRYMMWTVLTFMAAEPSSAAADAAASPWAWRSVNTQGFGWVTGVVVHPDPHVCPGCTYVRTDVGGAYKFNTTAGRWVPLMDTFSAAFSGVWDRSRTGGLTLPTVVVFSVRPAQTLPYPLAPSTRNVVSIAVDPSSPGTVYAAVSSFARRGFGE
eukprot:gene7926-7341_t